MAKFIYKRLWYSKAFVPVLLSKHRYLICFGARGSSKTHHIILKLLAATFSKHHVSAYYCRHQYETIRKTTFKDICLFLDKKAPDLKQYFKYSTSVNGSMVFTNTLTGNTLSPYGLDDPEATKGIPEATHIWIDEIDKCSEEQFAMTNSVLRTPNAEYLQFIGSFNPVSMKHWLRDVFFDPSDPYKPNPEFGDDIFIHHSTARDNEYIDVDDYIRNLMLAYAGDQNAIGVNIHGKWGQPENKNPWLYNFDYDNHTRDNLPFFPRHPVYLAFDFNNDPFACTVWQFAPDKGTKNAFLHCIKEYSGYYKIDDMLSRIKSDYPYSIIYVTGDRSGNNQDIGRNQTLYQMIQAKLNLSSKQVNLNTHNLHHSDSRVLCNAMFYHYPNLYIDRKNCPNLITQCQNAKVDDKVNKPSHLLKDRGDNKNDEFDSMRYLMQTYFLDYCKKMYNIVK